MRARRSERDKNLIERSVADTLLDIPCIEDLIEFVRWVLHGKDPGTRRLSLSELESDRRSESSLFTRGTDREEYGV